MLHWTLSTTVSIFLTSAMVSPRRAAKLQEPAIFIPTCDEADFRIVGNIFGKHAGYGILFRSFVGEPEHIEKESIGKFMVLLFLSLKVVLRTKIGIMTSTSMTIPIVIVLLQRTLADFRCWTCAAAGR